MEKLLCFQRLAYEPLRQTVAERVQKRIDDERSSRGSDVNRGKPQLSGPGLLEEILEGGLPWEDA